jgi:hypothetical protein
VQVGQEGGGSTYKTVALVTVLRDDFLKVFRIQLAIFHKDILQGVLLGSLKHSPQDEVRGWPLCQHQETGRNRIRKVGSVNLLRRQSLKEALALFVSELK